MKTRTCSALAVLLLTSACGSKATQVIVTIDAEPGVKTDSMRLHLVVAGGVGRTTAPTAVRFDRVLTPGTGDPAYPFELALAPLDGDVGRSYGVTATAETTAGAFIAQARIIGGYVEGETTTVRLVLEDACRTVMCGAEQTCKAGACVDARVVGPVDAGVRDAGVPDAHVDLPDTGPPEDGGEPPLDAGQDGGPPPVDAGPLDLGVLVDMGTRCASRPTGDTRWARYPLPGSPGHPRSYEVVIAGSDETVIDCVTGLEWQRAYDATTYTQADAIAHCDGLTLAGYLDWRLPSRFELMTLVDYTMGSPGPTIHRPSFPMTGGVEFWTASPDARTPGNGWDVSFRVGNAATYDSALNLFRARCVR